MQSVQNAGGFDPAGDRARARARPWVTPTRPYARIRPAPYGATVRWLARSAVGLGAWPGEDEDLSNALD